MFDLHSHIFPGLDDGAEDLDTAVEMLKLAVEHGTTTICGTPHVIEGQWLPSWEEITNAYQQLCEAAVAANLNITIYPGAEVAMNYDLLELLKAPGPYCLNNSSYILIELPALEIPSFADDFLFTLQTRGFNPILAHPERNPEVGKRPEIIREWIGHGILVQTNCSSLTGRMGERVMKTAELLVRSNMVHCIGSDAHGTEHRRPILNQAYDKVNLILGAELCQSLFFENPAKIVANRTVDIPEVDPIRRHSGFLGWFARK